MPSGILATNHPPGLLRQGAGSQILLVCPGGRGSSFGFDAEVWISMRGRGNGVKEQQTSTCCSRRYMLFLLYLDLVPDSDHPILII